MGKELVAAQSGEEVMSMFPTDRERLEVAESRLESEEAISEALRAALAAERAKRERAEALLANDPLCARCGCTRSNHDEDDAYCLLHAADCDAYVTPEQPLLDRLAAAERDLAEARATLATAIDLLDDALPYVDEYFRKKWGHDNELARIKAAASAGREEGGE